MVLFLSRFFPQTQTSTMGSDLSVFSIVSKTKKTALGAEVPGLQRVLHVERPQGLPRRPSLAEAPARAPIGKPFRRAKWKGGLKGKYIQRKHLISRMVVLKGNHATTRVSSGACNVFDFDFHMKSSSWAFFKRFLYPLNQAGPWLCLKESGGSPFKLEGCLVFGWGPYPKRLQN